MKHTTKSLLGFGKCREKILPVFLGLIFVWFLVFGIVVKTKLRKINLTPLKREKGQEVLPILVIACNEAFLERSLGSLTYFRRNPNVFPIIVYNDRGSKQIDQVVNRIAEWDHTISIIHNPNPNGNLQLKIALDYVFGKLLHDAVIVLDDNLDISSDFFEYFLATYRLMKEDRSIWCISAWNDNGKRKLINVNQPHLLHRTDFFPGKGWMMRYETWKEIEPHLEKFDDKSLNIIARDRVCIRPEISRTSRFGVCNMSRAQMEDSHLRHEQTEINTEFVPFTQYNLTYLLKKNELYFLSHVYACPEATVDEVMSGRVNSSWAYCVQIPYSNAAMFRATAKMFGLMHDSRRGIIRTALHGIVQCVKNGVRVYLTPEILNIYRPKDKINEKREKSVRQYFEGHRRRYSVGHVMSASG